MERDARRYGKKSKLRLGTRRQKCKNLLNYKLALHRSGTEFPIQGTSGYASGHSIMDNQTNSPINLERDMAVIETCLLNQIFQEPGEKIFEENVKADDADILPKKDQIGEISIEGFRIVDFTKFIEQLIKLSDHPPFGCSLKNLKIIREHRQGFRSTFSVVCNMCKFTGSIDTCPTEIHKMDINTAAVAGIMNVGGGYCQIKQFNNALNIPTFGVNLYNKLHTTVCKAWEETAWTSMSKAADEERKLAIESGSVDSNGMAMITVVCDGSWAKRSYRTGANYNSLSGTAAIIGAKTGKILFLGVKNKYCCICQRYENKKINIPSHECYKNYTGSSTAMEASIIADGFCKSIGMYNIIYNKMIADGDSSCYKKIIDSRPYQTHVVQKIECRNHLLRNYCNKLREVAKTRGVPGSLKNIILKNILKCRTAIMKAVKFRNSEKGRSEEEKILALRKDILNSCSHIFGEHKNCLNLKYFCDKSAPDKNNYMSDLRTFGLEEKIMGSVRYLAGHSRSLLENVDTNLVEQFNAMIAQKIGGKRVNYTARGSYQGRCFAAVVAKNTRKPLYTIYKHLLGGHSPHRNILSLEKSIQKKNERRKGLKRRKLCLSYNKDEDYGEECRKPDIDETNYNLLKEEFLNNLNKSDEEFIEIERTTRLQTDSADWLQIRKQLLTSSKFGEICKMRPTTSCEKMVESILYKSFCTKATAWGRNNEERAKGIFNKKYPDFKISDCGIYINKKWPFLGASPDGVIIEENSLLEIKCPYSARNSTIMDAVDKKINKLFDER